MAQSLAKANLVHNAPLLVIGLLMIDSLHFVFARMLLPHLPPVTSAMFVLLVAAGEMAVFAAITGRLDLSLRPLRQHLWFFLGVGFLVAASTALNYGAVAFIDPGTAALLAKASVLFGLAFGIFWLGDRLTRRQLVGAGLAIAGVVVITFQPGDYLRAGALMVLASTVMYALHAALVKRYGGGLKFIDFFLFRLLCTATFLFLFTAASGHLVWPSGQAWLLLLLVGTVDVVISRALYYLALRELTMSMHTLVLTLSPVAAIVWSFFLFDALPSPQQLAGGAAVLLGVLLVTWRRR
ncbi:MAG: DMT family transporter [Anaerolineae bacterium]